MNKAKYTKPYWRLWTVQKPWLSLNIQAHIFLCKLWSNLLGLILRYFWLFTTGQLELQETLEKLFRLGQDSLLFVLSLFVLNSSLHCKAMTNLSLLYLLLKHFDSKYLLSNTNIFVFSKVHLICRAESHWTVWNYQAEAPLFTLYQLSDCKCESRSPW